MLSRGGMGSRAQGSVLGGRNIYFLNFPSAATQSCRLSLWKDARSGLKSGKTGGELKTKQQRRRQLVCTGDRWRGTTGWKKANGVEVSRQAVWLPRLHPSSPPSRH